MQPTLDALLHEQGIAALLIVAFTSRDPYIAPFAGGGRFGHSLVVVKAGDSPRLGFFTPLEREEAAHSGLPLLTPDALGVGRVGLRDAPRDEFWANIVERALQLCALAPGPIGLAGSLPAGMARQMCARLEDSGWSLLAGETLLERWRKRKNEGDLREIRRSAGGTCKVFRAVAGLLSEAVAQDGRGIDRLRHGDKLFVGGRVLDAGRVRRLVARAMAECGFDQPAGNIIAAGRDGAVPHNVGDNAAVLHAGESLIVDLFPRAQLFADCTRTFCVGPAPDALAAAHATVIEAVELAERHATPGVSGWSLQESVCAFFESRGYPTPISHPGTERGYVHGLGHGVGYDVHELPIFRQRPSSHETVLEAGDVITLEPGLYEPDESWAVRVEDLYAVTADGLDQLTDLTRDLDPRVYSQAH